MQGKKTIWITGASSGIGSGLARQYIEQGHFVIVSGRNRESLGKLEALAPQRVRAVDFDLSGDFSADLASRIKEHTDTLDLVILAAGVCEYVDRPDCDLELYRRVMEVNFFAQIKCARVALAFLNNSELHPQLVGIGSLAAHLPFPRAEAYGASKAAFEYWLDSMRIDLASTGIDITLVSPGFVDTPLTRKNDFAMPTLMSLEQSLSIIFSGIEKRRRHVRFPRRLSWSLRLLSMLDSIWYGVVAPRMSRNTEL
jgi:short-subunit dehydrogenase